MSISPQALTDAYTDCLNEAFRQCPLIIQGWCGQLVDAMYDRSMLIGDNAEKRQLQDAIASLKRNQAAIEHGFAPALAREIADDTKPPSAGKSDRGGKSFSSLSFDDLELMGDNQVQETVDSARLMQVISMGCEAGLSVLSARLSTAQGFKSVKTDKNPLRPEIISQALLKLLQGLPADSNARSRWLVHGAQIMGRQLQSLYVELNEQLVKHGIAPAAYGVIPPAEKGGRAAEAPAEPPQSGQLPSVPAGEPVAAAPGKAGAEAVLTLDRLHHLLVGDYDESFKADLLPSGFDQSAQQNFSHTVPAAMEVLAELKEKGTASTRARKARTPPPQQLTQMRAQLKLEAKSLGQSLAIEVVGLMIEQMARDPRLLEPVRKVIADAEPAYLRLGVNDPRFFSDKNHPGRRLLEAITARSLAYSSESVPGFAGFMDDLQAVASLLTEEHATDAQHFATLLKSFEQSQALRKTADGESQGRAVQALLQAEQRNLMAEKVAAEIRARPDFVSGNRIVTAFFTGPWAQVMAQERLMGEHGGEGARKAEFSLTLGEVLWSLDPGQTSKHRKRLVRMIPDMLEKLRAGLLSIDYPLAQSKPFFDELMALHQAALKAEPDVLDEQAEKARKRRDLEDAFDARDASHSMRPWLAPTEAQNSGFMNDVGDNKPGFEPTQPHSQPPSPGDAVQDQRTADPSGSVALRLGDWVELLQDTQWVRAQLTWISPYQTLYMFTSEGGRTHSMTGPLLEYLLLQELVKVVSQQGVLDGALDTVARTAMRNSVDGSGH
ncbi:MAG: DUF1631 family protein [Polaromonas sp.]|uniref:DUF1631 family protein n=1 Tax=Polaromonas sp. TaxID=1869339 RepID=UPI0025EE1E42|nr:DUF1631 family protein [Polaromonas sp.]MBI2726599.1 DUF1631 family protein [Polaromonas sp.]